MYLKKIETLEQIIESEIDLDSSSLTWQYLFLIAYWYAKAELTLVGKQNSLNDFSLLYIYEDLLEMTLSPQEKKVLSVVQKQREDYRSGKCFNEPDISLVNSFNIIKIIQINKDQKDFIEISQNSLKKIWDNEEDSIYDKYL